MALGPFFPAPDNMPVTFDEGIASVTMDTSVNGTVGDPVTITESGTFDVNTDASTDYIRLTITPKDGYALSGYTIAEAPEWWTVSQDGNVIELVPTAKNSGVTPTVILTSEASAASTTITYNGNEIASLEAGKTATLACAGKKAVTDIVVAFGSGGSITYDGTTTDVEAGKTANLLCSGKKFATDVVVAVAVADDSIIGTWLLNETLLSIDPTPGNLSVNGEFHDYNSNVLSFSLFKAPSNAFELNQAWNIRNSYYTDDVGTADLDGDYIRSQNVSYTLVDKNSEVGVKLRTFTIINGDDVDNEALKTWLKVNATKVS